MSNRRILEKRLPTTPTPGWTKTADYGKGYVWTHETGWVIERTSHPTANYPFSVYRPDGQLEAAGTNICAFAREQGAGRVFGLGELFAIIDRIVAAEGWKPTRPTAPAVDDLPLFAPRTP